MWWKDMKMRICIIVGIILLLIVIIVPSGQFGTRSFVVDTLTDLPAVIAGRH